MTREALADLYEETSFIVTRGDLTGPFEEVRLFRHPWGFYFPISYHLPDQAQLTSLMIKNVTLDDPKMLRN